MLLLVHYYMYDLELFGKQTAYGHFPRSINYSKVNLPILCHLCQCLIRYWMNKEKQLALCVADLCVHTDKRWRNLCSTGFIQRFIWSFESINVLSLLAHINLFKDGHQLKFLACCTVRLLNCHNACWLFGKSSALSI